MRSTQGSRADTAGPDAEPQAGPAAPRMILGARLRELREAQYVSRQQAAEAIRTTHAHIGALELGRTGCRPRDIADLLTIYSVTDEAERAMLLALADQANSPGWWHAYLDVLPDWVHTYLGLEQAAAVIRSYEPQYVPGLLQTPAYAHAVITLGHCDASAVQLQRCLEVRMRRQRILYGARPPHLWAVIDEAALRRPVGGTTTLHAQIEHLIRLCELPHITLQVLPFRASGRVAAGGPVTLLRLPERGLPDVIYLEQLRSADYPDEPEDVEFHRHVIDGLATTAEPAAATPGVLRRILRDDRASAAESG